MKPRVFRLFACCVPVRGARRSTLCDLQRQQYRFIPNGLYEILTVHRGRGVDEVKAAYGNRFDARVDEYFAFLEDNEFGFWCDDPDAFPDLDLTFEAPETISNAIIDVGPASRHDFASLFRQLDDLGCRALQLRFYREAELDEVEAVLRLTDAGRLRSVELLLRHREGWTPDDMERLCRAFPRLSSVQVHAAPAAASRRSGESATIVFHTRTVDSAEHCGHVHPAYFITGISLFTEAQAHNTCLNRKLSVDERGEIRNCPALPRSFGNARDTSLHAALLQDGFRELWNVCKDQVETCRDCEFRYLCTDCRAFVRAPGDPLSKPAKCSYDPYTARWA
ncbi:MAG: hypothetical protein QOJ98_2281 [Acidobacteriota bacterium]|jgi:SPASM domain peptide maturase of grasp-with-spasm system|nr:hypothetical protein [Acidobacteriota bacterium]